MYQTKLVQDREKSEALVNTVINLTFPSKLGEGREEFPDHMSDYKILKGFVPRN